MLNVEVSLHNLHPLSNSEYFFPNVSQIQNNKKIVETFSNNVSQIQNNKKIVETFSNNFSQTALQISLQPLKKVLYHCSIKTVVLVNYLLTLSAQIHLNTCRASQRSPPPVRSWRTKPNIRSHQSHDC